MSSDEKKKFQCGHEDCQKKFSTISHLKRHENVHSKSMVFRCDKCDAIFSTQYNQKRHMDNKHLKKNPKKYQCEYCEEDFNEKSWLTKHMYRHTGILPYACTFENCEARFLVPSKLQRHLKTHEGFPCPKENCSEKFAKWNDLMHHMKIGHPIVHKCAICEQVFARSTNLRAHIETHSSDRPVFLCPKKGCRRFYYTKKNLKHHIKHYHEKRPFSCTIGQCSKCFKSQKNLDKHISTHTSIGRLKKEVLDSILSTPNPVGEINMEDYADHISIKNFSEHLKDATVIYLKKDDTS